jgi:hypothetical protein
MYGTDPSISRGARKSLFSLLINDEPNCVNFPLLEAVLAGLWQERNRNLWALGLAIVSLGIAIGSLVVAVVAISM